MKIAVISGGFSEERQASIESGKCIAGALQKLGHTVAVIGYDPQLMENIAKAAPDVIFPMVQGKHHGDGAVQAMLALTGIPYIGSRPHAAAVINHKTVCKKIWRAEKILTPDFFEYPYAEYIKDSFEDFTKKAERVGLTLPVVAKAPTQGNRFGIVFVKDSGAFDALRSAFAYDDALLVEQYVKGRFITQGILEISGTMTALPPVEIIDDSDDEFKQYPGGSAVRAHNLTDGQLSEINRVTLRAAALAGASGFGRLDYHLSGDKLYLLEINAVPGLVPGYSSMGECAAAAGYEYGAFLEMLLATAKKDRQGRQDDEKPEIRD